jgi:geranylgeranyl diphosphate synthase type I
MTDSPSQVGHSNAARFRERLEAHLAALLASRQSEAQEISADAAAMIGFIARLASGGKRVRAVLAFDAYLACGGSPDAPEILDLGAAIELFQTAALIHDDILDRSDTRRGQPSVHRAFESLHGESGWALDGPHFGESAAILTGDLALAMADEAFASLGAAPHSPLRRRYDRMRWEVMVGQYLDIVEEVAAPTVAPEDAAARAMTVLRYKSAKYTFEHPTALGALLAGADAETEQAFAEFALPIGEAFQLADDDLGVFGDPSVTGKPAGDDLLEGKRTLLIAFAMERASTEERALLEEVLGSAATDVQLEAARDILIRTGARDRARETAESLAEDGIRRLTLPGHRTSADDDDPQIDVVRRGALEHLKSLALAAVSRSH